MEKNNPELQDKLSELEHELEVSRSVSAGRRRVLGFRRVPEWDVHDPSGMLRMDTNL